MTDIHVPPGWKKLAEGISKQKGVVIILGATDTGKTTLAFYLCQELSRGCKVAMISGDIGQCAFGPPATLSLSILGGADTSPATHHKGNSALSSLPKGPGLVSIEDAETCPGLVSEIRFMYFIGSTSPMGHLLQVTVGLKKLVEKAQGEGAEVVVVDTSGFVEGGAAWELKFQKIELVNARHLVALQRRRELEAILSPHESRTCRSLYRLGVYEGIKLRSYEQRREYRKKKFLEYFQGATIKNIPLAAIRLVNPLNIVVGEGSGGLYKRLLVGLNDDENFTLGLGIIEDMGLKELRVLTPVKELVKVKIVRFGAIRLDENWYDSRAKLAPANLRQV